jgi:hypothetical protein
VADVPLHENRSTVFIRCDEWVVHLDEVVHGPKRVLT